MLGRSFSSDHSVRTSDGRSFGLRPGILILLLLLLSSRPLAAQDEILPVFHFNRISAADGLPSNEIRSRVVRDQNGYAWIGTAHGLARYDGYRCKECRNDPNDPYSLSSNYIASLLVDSKQRLWVGTAMRGMFRVDWKKKDVRNYFAEKFLHRSAFAFRLVMHTVPFYPIGPNVFLLLIRPCLSCNLL